MRRDEPMKAAENLESNISQVIDKSEYEVLVVDDEDTIVTMLTEILSFEGYVVRAALNGEDALKTIYQKRPDLIILDLMMPGISGFEVCKELKTQREFNAIPIIMLTAKKSMDDRKAGLRVGANDYITKPFEMKDLLNSIEEQIGNTIKIQREEGIECHARFELKSDFAYMKQVNDLVMRMFKQTKMSEEEIAEFEYCLNEALMNAIEHGSKLDSDKIVIVSYTLKKDTLILEIEDQGTGFDFRTIPDPTSAENIFKSRGRGIYIMKKYMDEVFYNKKGTKITLMKNLES